MSLVRPRTSSAEAFEKTALDTGSDPHAPRAIVDEMEHWIGRRLDHFQIERALGAGGMGAVFLGRDLSLDRPVAIKVLPQSLAEQAGHEERFIREARAQARLKSPHVVHIYYIGHVASPHPNADDQTPPPKGSLFFAMEWVDGDSLEQLATSKRVPPEEARLLMLEVARGLRDAHAAGIIHRDIKPSNLLRDKRGYVKIADFGLAKPMDGDAKITQQGVVLGSPLYLAPEQARAEEVDHRADMYALGCTFFHLVAGAPPFDGPTPLAIVAKHLSASPPTVAERAPDVPPRLAQVLERLMKKDAQDRYATYDDLIHALEACAPGTTEYAGFWTRGAAALLDALVAGALVYALGAIGLALDAAYLTIAHAYFGQTLGKYLLRIEVARPNGRRLGLARSALRTLASTWFPFFVVASIVVTGGVPELTSIFDPARWEQFHDMRMFAMAVAASHAILALLYAAGLGVAAFHRQKRALHDFLAGSQVTYKLRGSPNHPR